MRNFGFCDWEITHLVILGEEDLSTSGLEPPFRPFTLLRLVLDIRSEKRRHHRNGLGIRVIRKKDIASYARSSPCPTSGPHGCSA